MGKINLKKILKATGLKEYSVHFGTFDYVFHCVVGDYSKLPKYLAYKWEITEKEVLKWNRELDGDYTPRGRFYRYEDFCPIIWIPKKPKTPREIATLAHEILHLVYELCRWVGLPLTSDTEEVRTHAQAHALTELLSRIK